MKFGRWLDLTFMQLVLNPGRSQAEFDFACTGLFAGEPTKRPGLHTLHLDESTQPLAQHAVLAAQLLHLLQ